MAMPLIIGKTLAENRFPQTNRLGLLHQLKNHTCWVFHNAGNRMSNFVLFCESCKSSIFFQNRFLQSSIFFQNRFTFTHDASKLKLNNFFLGLRHSGGVLT